MTAFDILGIWVGALLTLLVFSYLLADSMVFRIAQAIFVGVAIGYGATLVLHRVVLQGILVPFVTGALDETFLLFIFLIFLGLPLFLKYRAGGELWSVIGNLPMGYLVGVGAALALGGALAGTLVPQFLATGRTLRSPTGSPFDLVNNLVLLVGTLGALLSFRFTNGYTVAALRPMAMLVRAWGFVGRWFVLIALGALFATAVTARVSVLVNQVYFLLHDWLGVVR